MVFVVVGAIGLVVIVIVLVYQAIVRTRRNRIAVWTETASLLGLEFEPPARFGQFKMSGYVSGFHVDVYTYTQSHGQSSSTYTSYNVRFPASLELGLKLKKEGKILGKIARFFGAQDHAIDDADFDSAFMIKGDDADGVRQFLTEERKAFIMELQNKLPSMMVHDRGISWDKGGVSKDVTLMTETVAEMTRVAFHLGGHLIDDSSLQE